jgi:hypothetical protein
MFYGFFLFWISLLYTACMPFYESTDLEKHLTPQINKSNETQRLVQVISQVAFYDRLYSEDGYAGRHTKKRSAGIWVELLDLGSINQENSTCLVSSFLTSRITSQSIKDDPLAVVSQLDQNRSIRQEGQVIATTHSNRNGWFQFNVALYAHHCYQIRAVSDLTLRNAHAQVLDHDGEGVLYAMSRDFIIGNSPLTPPEIIPFPITNDLVLLVPHLTAPIESPIAGALHILQNTYLGYALIQKYSDLEAPTLKYRWAPGRAVPCGSCYRRSEILLGGQVEDPDHYDDHIILHEMGHYFIDYWSHDDSPGGRHRGRFVNPLLAYGEGVAYFWSALVLQDPLIVDWMLGDLWIVDIEAGIFNGEAVTLGVEGDSIVDDQHEELISTIMWDAYDDNEIQEHNSNDNSDIDNSQNNTDSQEINTTEEHDYLAIGEALSMYLLIDKIINRTIDLGPRGVDLSDWLNLLSCLPEVDIETVFPMIDYSLYPWELEAEQSCMKSEGNPFKWSLSELHDSESLWIDIDQTIAQHNTHHFSTSTVTNLHTMPYGTDLSVQETWHVEWYVGTPPYHSKQESTHTCVSFPCNLSFLFKELEEINSFTVPIIFQMTHSTTRYSWYLSWVSPRYQYVLQKNKGKKVWSMVGKAHQIKL